MSNTVVPIETAIREIHLDNGLTFRFYDFTRRYYGDFFLVKLEARCQIPLRKEYFENAEAFDEARVLLGEVVLFKRTLERMGTPAAEVGRAIAGLMANFEAHALAYFASPSFPTKLVMSQLSKTKHAQSRFNPSRSVFVDG